MIGIDVVSKGFVGGQSAVRLVEGARPSTWVATEESGFLEEEKGQKARAPSEGPQLPGRSLRHYQERPRSPRPPGC